MSHTKEPWVLRQGNEIGVPDKSETQSYGMLNVIARVDKFDFENWQENARRIVACVNACAGSSTEFLEGYGKCLSIAKNAKPFKNNIDDLVAQRDELERKLVKSKKETSEYMRRVAELGGSISINTDNDLDNVKAQRDELLAALKVAAEFIDNGIEFGFIRMPDQDTPDSAHKTPQIIRDAIAKCEAQS